MTAKQEQGLPPVTPKDFLGKPQKDQVSLGIPKSGLKLPLPEVKPPRVPRLPPGSRAVISVNDRISGRERIKEEDLHNLPVTIMKLSEAAKVTRHQRVRKSFALVDRQGAVHFPTLDSRSYVQVPQKYGLITEQEDGLSKGATVFPARQFSELSFKRVDEENGLVEAAIRKAEQIRRKNSRLVTDFKAINESLDKVRDLYLRLQGSKEKRMTVSEEELKDLTDARQRTVGLLEACEITPPFLVEPKKECTLAEVETLHNWVAAAKSRWEEAVLVARRYKEIVEKLREQRNIDRGMLVQIAGELGKKIGERSQGERIGFLKTQIHLLKLVRVRPYRHAAVSVAKELPKAQRLIDQGRFQEAETLLVPLIERLTQVLENSQDIYPQPNA